MQAGVPPSLCLAPFNALGTAPLLVGASDDGFEPRGHLNAGHGGIHAMLGVRFGGHDVNLAAPSAALATGEEAGEDRATVGLRRLHRVRPIWFWLFSAALVSVVSAAPPGMLETVACRALPGTLAASIASALAVAEERIGASVTFLIAASGLSFAGIGAAFWALTARLLVRWVLKDGTLGRLVVLALTCQGGQP